MDRIDAMRVSRSWQQLRPGDDYDAVLRKLGPPAAQRTYVEMGGRVFRSLGQREPGADCAARDVLRVGLVHLTAVRLDVDRGHYFLSRSVSIVSNSKGR